VVGAVQEASRIPALLGAAEEKIPPRRRLNPTAARVFENTMASSFGRPPCSRR